MTDRPCRADLAVIPQGETAPGDAIVYASQGRTIIVGAGRAVAGVAAALSIDRDVMLVGGDASTEPATGMLRLETVAGPAQALEGWLGAFTLRAGGRSLSADVVIDHGSRPLIDRSVPPFGYFATRGDSAALAQAATEARALVGRFHKPRYFTYEPRICAHESFGQTGCTRCLDVCGAQAIRSNGRTIAVEPHLCQGCAACALACPTGALSVAAPHRAALWADASAMVRAAPGAPLTVGTGPDATSGAFLETPAVAAFGEELWLHALADGAGAVRLAPDPAAPAETRALLATRVAEVNVMASVLGRGDAAALIGDEPGSGAAPTPATPAPPMTAAPDNQRKRDWLNAALARLEPEGGFAPAPLPAGAPLGAIVVDTAACVMCGICAQTCPTAAIAYGERDGQARLSFAEGNCIQCGLCARLCPEQAITLAPRLAPIAIRGTVNPLNEAPLAACEACGAHFTPQPLLASMLRKAGPSAQPAMLAQLRRCTPCRHKGAQNRF